MCRTKDVQDIENGAYCINIKFGNVGRSTTAERNASTRDNTIHRNNANRSIDITIDSISNNLVFCQLSLIFCIFSLINDQSSTE